MGAYIDRNMNLSEHFKLYEMLISETAERKGIQNNPSYYNVENLKGLCVNVGEPIRAYVRKDIKKNAVITVSSGFRSPALNKEIGSSNTSQHIKGEAMDFTIYGVDLFALYLWIATKSNINYDQIIAEYVKMTANTISPSWLHISYKRKPQFNRQLPTMCWKYGNETIYKHYSKTELLEGICVNHIGRKI